MEYRKHANHCVYDTGVMSFNNLAWPAGAVRPHPLTDAVMAGIVRAFKAVQTKMRERTTIRRLSDLDDHILHDIGVRRSEIRDTARKLAQNPGLDHRSLRA